MIKETRQGRKAEKGLDAFRQKRGRGRPQKIRRSEVYGRAENYREIFRQVWPSLRTPLMAAGKLEDAITAFENFAEPYAREFIPRLAEDILVVIREPKFPKRPEAQINFLADSLAGRPNVEPRTSRDICATERAKVRAKSPHKIIRKEFYIECSCGYKGPARDNACIKCGAEISLLPETVWGSRLP